MLIIAILSNVHLMQNEVVNATTTTSTYSKRLLQIPSEPADFPANNPNLTDFRVLKANKNIINSYEITGEIINLSDKKLYYPKPIVYLFDKDNEPVGKITTGLVMTSEIPAQSSSTFQIHVSPSELLGNPLYFKIGFKGTFSKN